MIALVLLDFRLGSEMLFSLFRFGQTPCSTILVGFNRLSTCTSICFLVGLQNVVFILLVLLFRGNLVLQILAALRMASNSLFIGLQDAVFIFFALVKHLIPQIGSASKVSFSFLDFLVGAQGIVFSFSLLCSKPLVF